MHPPVRRRRRRCLCAAAASLHSPSLRCARRHPIRSQPRRSPRVLCGSAALITCRSAQLTPLLHPRTRHERQIRVEEAQSRGGVRCKRAAGHWRTGKSARRRAGGECNSCAQPRCVRLVAVCTDCARLCAQLEEMVRLHAESAPSAEAAAPAAAGGHYQKPKMQQAYGKAIESIAKYPLPITSAEEAEELQGSQTHKNHAVDGFSLQLRIRRAIADTAACTAVSV